MAFYLRTVFMFQALLAPSCAEYCWSYELKWTGQEVWTRLKYVQLELLSLMWYLLFSHTHDSRVKCSVRCLYVYVIFALICSQQMLLILPRLPRQLLKRRKCSSHLSHCDSQLLTRVSVWAWGIQAHHINTREHFLCQRQMYNTI